MVLPFKVGWRHGFFWDFSDPTAVGKRPIKGKPTYYSMPCVTVVKAKKTGTSTAVNWQKKNCVLLVSPPHI